MSMEYIISNGSRYNVTEYYPFVSFASIEIRGRKIRDVYPRTFNADIVMLV